MLAIAFIAVILFTNIQFLSSGSNWSGWIYFIVVMLILALAHLTIYIQARKNYTTQKKISSPLQWKFSGSTIEAIGDGFSSEFSWDSLYKVVENKQYFLLYHSIRLANIIPKRDMSADQMLQFRQLLWNTPRLKSELLFVDNNHVLLSGELALASLTKRIVNVLIDTIAFLLIWAVLTVSFLLLLVILDVSDQKLNSLSNIAWIVLIPFYLLYYMICEYRFQRTIGKLLTRTKVVSINGKRPFFNQVFIRTLSRLIPFEFVTFILGSYGLHDKISNTRVVQLQKIPNKTIGITK